MPFYWMDETSGVLRAAVERYLKKEPVTDVQMGYLRAYLRQWMQGPWIGPGIAKLRSAVEDVKTPADLAFWLSCAEENDIDPL